MNKLTNIALSYRERVLKLVLFSFCVVSSVQAFSLSFQQKITRQTALAAFDRNDHEQALRQFSELSATYPKDPLYKYYCGVCLVKLERDPSKALSLLNDAISGSAAIVTVPSDGVFWLGRAQQMSGKFPEAIVSYEKFTALAGKKTAKEMNVPDFIKQCQENRGAVKGIAPVTVIIPSPEPVTNITAEKKDNPTGSADTAKKIIAPENPSGSYDSLLTIALVCQQKSDSLSAEAERLAPGLIQAEGDSKIELKSNIQALEKLALDYRKKAGAAMNEARKLNGRVQLPDTNAVASVETAKPARADTLIQVKSETTVQVVPVQPDKEIFSEFEIIEKPVYGVDEKMTVNPDVPPGLIYRIQVAVFRNPVAPSYFKGIKPVYGFRNEANGITTYYAGMFRRSADASKVLSKVKGLGFKDSFVAALMDRKTVSADRAAVLEKEWGSKPLYTVKPAAPDTTPKTLVFRVEIKRSQKPLPADQVESMKKMAGQRGFDVLVSEKKESVYLAGKFLTFTSAWEYADLLIRNGYRDSKVVAYLGNREIPVETARQLFDER